MHMTIAAGDDHGLTWGVVLTSLYARWVQDPAFLLGTLDSEGGVGERLKGLCCVYKDWGFFTWLGVFFFFLCLCVSVLCILYHILAFLTTL
ncbi:hypothetical protein BDW02DRAFT_383463 [Decorospora gaudefroyi]|uniref:Uncharacterized protein n=1 Tax=Decorospora gaudefroyi TaxID=184978 RepID=A0A6A5KFS5_9PLEO|nr:hypothetical protein BDW02DRAFT_383463 [Decorospora gaudefroyi]